ncbi:MAG TPA: serine/threonine-protein kinase, partial [Gemmata sp.]|nr:serine/threonine-protein kinase [Gemmata sp.]
MAVALSCPHCQTQLKLNRQPPSHKKSARCPKCKGAIPLNFPISEQSGIPFSNSQASGEGQPNYSEKSSEKNQQSAQPWGEPGEKFLAPPQQPDELGRLGHFRVLSRIGVGGMGMVFSAEDTVLKRQVALKVMLPQFTSNPIRKERFQREAHAQAKVEHEHIVVIFDVKEIDGVSCIIMPLLKGQSLFSALMQNPQPPLKEALRIGREMAEGLAAAHEAGLIHRDIKPSNVWLDGKRRRVKILDFGLARVVDTADVADFSEDKSSSVAETDNVALTVQGAVLGTPLYMSPEQACGEKIDHRTDLFSLGVVLYEMTAGSLPFSGQNKPAILHEVINHHPPAPRDKNPDLPQEVSDFIMQLLAKPVAERPADAEVVAETLQKLESLAESTDNQVALPALAVDDPWEELDPNEPSTLVEPAVRIPSETRKTKPNKTKKRAKAARKRVPTLIIGVVAGIVGGAVLVGVLVSLLKRPPQPQPQVQSQPDPEPVAPKGTTPPSPPPKPPAVVKKGFWPAEALREGRITLMDLSAVKVLKMDDFDDRATGWPHGKSEIKGATVQRGYKDGIYFIQKEIDGGATYVGNAQLGAFSNFVCQVEGRVVADPAANWELWFGNDQQRKALTVKINSAGKLTVAITENDKGEPEQLYSGTHDAIRKGYDFNKLAAIYTADRLEVFVNGVAVCDPLPVPVRLQPVSIALGVSGGKSSAEFRRLTVWTAEGLPTPEERLKSREVPVKDSFHLPFVWPVAALREGRISLPDLGKLKLLKTDEFTDPLTGWPVG